MRLLTTHGRRVLCGILDSETGCAPNLFAHLTDEYYSMYYIPSALGKDFFSFGRGKGLTMKVVVSDGVLMYSYLVSKVHDSSKLSLIWMGL